MATYPSLPLAEIALKHLALVGRRGAHFAELYESGRWRRYYTERELLALMRELRVLRDTWIEIAERGRREPPPVRPEPAGPDGEPPASTQAA